MSGRLEMILGCMYSGKSSELIKRIRQNRLLGLRVLVVNHEKDQRYATNTGADGMVVSHDNDGVEAVFLPCLCNLLGLDAFREADIICIDEGQFFHDLYDVVVDMVEGRGKHVIVSALDGTYERLPFFEVVALIPFADHVVKLNALCMGCKNGKPAAFSKRLVESDALELVGGVESYIPVCRMCFKS